MFLYDLYKNLTLVRFVRKSQFCTICTIVPVLYAYTNTIIWYVCICFHQSVQYFQCSTYLLPHRVMSDRGNHSDGSHAKSDDSQCDDSKSNPNSSKSSGSYIDFDYGSSNNPFCLAAHFTRPIPIRKMILRLSKGQSYKFL